MDAPETAKSVTIKKFSPGSAKLTMMNEPSTTAVTEAEAKIKAEAYAKLALHAAVHAQSRRSRFLGTEAQGEEEVDSKTNFDGTGSQHGKGKALTETNVLEAEGKRKQGLLKKCVGMLRRKDSYSEW